MTDVKALIERVEAATGPDREFDAEIARWQGWRWADDGYGYSEGWVAPHDWKGAREVVGRGLSSQFFELPAFTASIDAAKALVERVMPGWQWRVERDRAALWSGNEVATAMKKGQPALALMLALLRAIANTEKADG